MFVCVYVCGCLGGGDGGAANILNYHSSRTHIIIGVSISDMRKFAVTLCSLAIFISGRHL